MRARCRRWLVPWEPRPAGAPTHARGPRQLRAPGARHASASGRWGAATGSGSSWASASSGEITLSSIQRGPFQNAFVGYWVDEAMAGQGLAPEATVVVLRFAFEELGLHRVEIAIVPRNRASRRVVEKLEPARRGGGGPLPGDRRALGGPRPLRHDRRGVDGPASTSWPAQWLTRT